MINLETSITRSRDFAPGKAIHYRMSPGNIPCLAAVQPDACALANNHVLDFGRRGLEDTLEAMSGAGLRAVGAGRDADQARRPAAVPVPGGGRVVIFSCGTGSSGIAASWAAAPRRAGIDYLPDLSDATADEVIGRARAAKGPGDVVVVSIHWGSNWGYAVGPDQVRFAHRLIDGGANLIHGHSSHHPGPVEVFGGKLVLYGCGDCINDYEGITGHERYRGDLRLLYFASLQPGTGTLTALRMAPMQARNFRLHRARQADARFLGRPPAGWSGGAAARAVMSRVTSPSDLAAAARAVGVGDERVGGDQRDSPCRIRPRRLRHGCLPRGANPDRAPAGDHAAAPAADWTREFVQAQIGGSRAGRHYRVS